MKKIMDTKGICEIIRIYTLVFKTTNNKEKKRKKNRITIFEKKGGGLLNPLDHFEYS